MEGLAEPPQLKPLRKHCLRNKKKHIGLYQREMALPLFVFCHTKSSQSL